MKSSFAASSPSSTSPASPSSSSSLSNRSFSSSLLAAKGLSSSLLKLPLSSFLLLLLLFPPTGTTLGVVAGVFPSVSTPLSSFSISSFDLMCTLTPFPSFSTLIISNGTPFKNASSPIFSSRFFLHSINSLFANSAGVIFTSVSALTFSCNTLARNVGFCGSLKLNIKLLACTPYSFPVSLPHRSNKALSMPTAISLGFNAFSTAFAVTPIASSSAFATFKLSSNFFATLSRFC